MESCLLLTIVDEEFHTLLQKRFSRTKEHGCLRDIYDGEVYQKHMSPNGFLHNSMNISFTMNTDGAAVFKSSSASLWPVYLIINELPPQLRYKL